jgi:hypothetical protein
MTTRATHSRGAIAERHGIEAELPDLFDLIEDGPAAAVAANHWHGRAGR